MVPKPIKSLFLTVFYFHQYNFNCMHPFDVFHIYLWIHLMSYHITSLAWTWGTCQDCRPTGAQVACKTWPTCHFERFHHIVMKLATIFGLVARMELVWMAKIFTDQTAGAPFPFWSILAPICCQHTFSSLLWTIQSMNCALQKEHLMISRCDQCERDQYADSSYLFGWISFCIQGIGKHTASLSYECVSESKIYSNYWRS